MTHTSRIAAIVSSFEEAMARFNVRLTGLPSGSDPAGSVVKFALMGIARHNFVDGLSDAVDMLEHPDKMVRIAAAQAIAGFGDRGAEYRHALAAALVRETDPLVRNTLQGCIRQLDRKKE